MMLYLVLGLALLAVYGSKWMQSASSPKPNKAKSEYRKAVNELRQQAEELNTPSTYAHYSKLNRRVIGMEKELEKMPDFESNNDLYWVIKLMPYFAGLLFIGQSYEMKVYGEEVYWPIHNIIGTQDHKVFSLSLTAWYCISLIVIKSFW